MNSKKIYNKCECFHARIYPDTFNFIMRFADEDKPSQANALENLVALINPDELKIKIAQHKEMDENISALKNEINMLSIQKNQIYNELSDAFEVLKKLKDNIGSILNF